MNRKVTRRGDKEKERKGRRREDFKCIVITVENGDAASLAVN